MRKSWATESTSADKKMELSGKIVIGQFGAGSKSEHTAVYLETAQGKFVIRKRGENPFESSVLHHMAGRQVTAEGTLDSYLFLIDDIKEQEGI